MRRAIARSQLRSSVYSRKHHEVQVDLHLLSKSLASFPVTRQKRPMIAQATVKVHLPAHYFSRQDSALASPAVRSRHLLRLVRWLTDHRECCCLRACGISTPLSLEAKRQIAMLCSTGRPSVPQYERIAGLGTMGGKSRERQKRLLKPHVMARGRNRGW